MVRAAEPMTRRVAASQFRDDITQCPKLEIDTEKQDYAYSSRDTSLDHDEDSRTYLKSPYDTAISSNPILGKPTQPSKRKRRYQFYRVPHSIMRWICLGVFMSLLLFIAFLFRFTISGSSFRAVPLELSRPKPRPPQWESFPFLSRYYGGIRTLVSRQDNIPEYPGDGTVEKIMDSPSYGKEGNDKSDKRSEAKKSLVFNPYPDYKSESYVKKYGVKNDCFLDADTKTSIPPVRHFPGIPKGFPDAAMGSNKLLGINDDVCFERFGRLGPYGLGYGIAAGGTGGGLEGDRSGIDEVWKEIPAVDFRTVKWSEAQERCIAANSHRFPKLGPPRVDRFGAMKVGTLHARAETVGSTPLGENKDSASTVAAANDTLTLPRSAMLIRTWSDYQYNEESIMYLRSLISELSLMSGGEYIVHFLIHVKDDNLQIWSDDDTYDRVLKNALPAEFRGMGTLWSERQMGLLYGGLQETFARDLPVHGVYRSTFMPVQWFSHQHPEYDFIWNWEMDARYTGHWYHLFSQVSEWAKQQPRKGLWERNARFYVPSVHGSWEDFRQMIRVQTEIGTDNPNNMWATPQDKNRPNGQPEAKGDKPIWGPERPHEQDVIETDGEGIPPTTYEKDKYQWGVGEDADLIVFNPIYDPEGTTWLLRDDVTGYNKSEGMPPRRAAIITSARLSRKLLATMHRETSIKRHTMFSEMWPATAALHHGLKAVFAPHPVYIDRRWPTKYLEATFNAGRNGATGGSRISVFGDREHNFRGTTWFYSAGHSPNLWRRWFGYRVDGRGGEEYELATEGRMCLPPMLLHPIKELEMIIESVDR
ncbi:hypothetical protein, variant [Blastomyces gilchristii SLH14081]|uniref:Major facilitator superfamily transporter n=1 Tax=Blastomyces gilchristii (strain SLH14081) TaxID=559298 RepID=A0A179U659_BLAGS|nr:uncharacterized protein BDBG_00199 [Blastomyces gilchristii SLH14081]XP_031575668.1 hypothetical protein, variant [Blastomyces gilchristii SLH14081]OAT03485.1 hypothetical protein BDBG_00199 [Blastomyces gilchristii SLH14081]OAT03486.1 hypothetical protein, variant [Blastomyces gilchristii SLH14081]